MEQTRKIGFIYRDPKVGGKSIENVFNVIKDYLSVNSKNTFVNIYIDGSLSILENRRLILNHKCDLYHITGDVYYYAPLLWPAKVTQTIHDFGSMNQFSRIKKWVYLIVWHIVPTFFCRATTVVSKFTQNEFKRYLKKLGKSEVIYNPVNPKFKFTSRCVFPQKKFTILIVGTAPNKNVRRMIRALSGLDCLVNIVGFLDHMTLEDLRKCRIEYNNYVSVTTNELINHYKVSDCVFFASLHEGFGLPVIEANAIGRPVVVGSVCSLTEITGNAGLLVDPYDIDEMKMAIISLSRNYNLWNRLVTNGIDNIKRFQLDKISHHYERLFISIINSNN